DPRGAAVRAPVAHARHREGTAEHGRDLGLSRAVEVESRRWRNRGAKGFGEKGFRRLERLEQLELLDLRPGRAGGKGGDGGECAAEEGTPGEGRGRRPPFGWLGECSVHCPEDLVFW